MKARQADPLLLLTLGCLSLAAEAGLRVAEFAGGQLLRASAESKQFLGPRVLPVRERGSERQM